MNLSYTEIDNLNLNLNFNDDTEDVEDVGTIDSNGKFTSAAPKKQMQMPAQLGSRVPQPRITTMAHKNRGSLAQNIATPTARAVTYDDILSSLNMKVVDGKLQIVRNHAAENIRTNNVNLNQSINQSINYKTKKPIHTLNQEQHNQFMKQQQTNYMFNSEEKPQQNVPIMTKEQYKQMVAANYLKTLQEQQRIRNMKSTKLMFSNSNTNTNVVPVVSQNGGNGLNRLFRINGK
jgi:hypothetical protein